MEGIKGNKHKKLQNRSLKKIVLKITMSMTKGRSLHWT